MFHKKILKRLCLKIDFYPHQNKVFRQMQKKQKMFFAKILKLLDEKKFFFTNMTKEL